MMKGWRWYSGCAGMAALAVLLVGCSVTTFRTSDKGVEYTAMTAPVKYNIVNSEVIVLEAPEDGSQMATVKVNLLKQALKNHPGQVGFDAVWKKAGNELEEMGHPCQTDDTASCQICSRGVNPMVFEDTPTSVPVKLRTLFAMGPAKISPWWMTGYLLSVSMSPMRRYCYGAAIVAVLDNNGKTIDSRTILFQDSFWFSGLFPTALFGEENMCASVFFFNGLEEAKLDLRRQMAVQAATAALCEKPAAVVSPAQNRWINIRTAVIESVVGGNNAAAIRLLNSAAKENIGGEELIGMMRVYHL